jgi:hypothetical protein
VAADILQLASHAAGAADHVSGKFDADNEPGNGPPFGLLQVADQLGQPFL